MSSDDQLEAAFQAASPAEKSIIQARLKWVNSARPKQIPVDGADIWMALAGRGFGKTRTAVEDAWWYAFLNPGHRIAFVAPTNGDLRRTVFRGISGFASVVPEAFLKGGNWRDAYNNTHFELTFANGSMVIGYSSKEPERLRGPEHHRAYCDEFAAWENMDTYDMLQFGLRQGEHPQTIITTTPKPIKEVREIVKAAQSDAGVVVVRGSTFDNKDNLSPRFLKRIKDRYEGTRLGRQELYAEILQDVEGALWTHEVVERQRMAAVPRDDEALFQAFMDEFETIVVSIDPAVTARVKSDETGIIVAGKRTKERDAIVLEDLTMKGAPVEWAIAARDAARRWGADRIVAEVNNGGDLVKYLMGTVREEDSDFWKYREVRASRGKAVRAEPVATLYEREKVWHCGRLPQLEEQMFMMTSDFDGKVMGFSPDRVDAVVWAITDLLIGHQLGAPLGPEIVELEDGMDPFGPAV